VFSRRDWIRTATGLAFVGGWASGSDAAYVTDPRVERNRLLPPSPNNPRNSEGSFIWLDDGRLLLGYTHFYGGAGDNAAARIAGRTSADQGREWSREDLALVDNEGSENVMSVSFLRLASGEIALFYARKNGWDDCRLYMRTLDDGTEQDRSFDPGQDGASSFGEPVLAIPQEGYFVVNNDRVVQLTSGRLVVPAARHPMLDGRWSARGISTAFLSDDSGATWEGSTTELHGVDGSGSGLQEPGVVELRDGRLMMLMRTDQGCQFRSWSEDGGESWSAAEPTDIISPVSPASVKRIPATDDLLMVYNDHRTAAAEARGKRTPLTTAISTDEGASWENVKVLEDDPQGWYCYTAITFTEDHTILGYCAGNAEIGGLNLLQITRIETGWLYD